MQPTKMNDFNEIMTGRRSIRTYDQNVTITRDEMKEILTKAATAPSSVNLQPWRFLVVDTPEGKETLLPLAKFNKTQVETSSAVIAVFADMQSPDYLEEILTQAVDKGFMPAEVKERQLQTVSGLLAGMDHEKLKEMNVIDASLISMQLMLVARAYGYDTNPMGGYEKDQIAEAFGMDKERYYPVMLLSIGKAVDEGYSSVRLDTDSIVEWR
ncbi:nitroreductase family protein [Alkalicoccobacillus plakortidis]|uniref:Nitroreductase family protein n=1 Tax=Alkalicoccobacillus plakortidis TaxID=444060 RepID=A0ABT0XNP1_9BACI|nr:nitroreductase family protein [Alkalicoccobacillus plakortidis]MCM2677525.1 nitroreductase family protein [Alkalicoccobacillus plakortidis]